MDSSKRDDIPPIASQIRLCPRCGAVGLIWHSSNNFECCACNFTLYLNVAAAVAVIIEAEGKILVGVRKNEPCKGMLDLPGGFADPGESVEECARREVLEETGLALEDMAYFMSLPNTYLYRSIPYNTLDSVMVASLSRLPQVAPGDDLDELLWVERSALDLTLIAFDSLREAVRLYLSR